MIRAGLCLFLFINLSGCFLFKEDPKIRAQDMAAQGRKADAVQFLKEYIKSTTNEDKALEVARYGAQVAHLELRDYPSSTVFYRYLVNYSNDQQEQLSSLRYLGMIYFDHLKDFELAVATFEVILRYQLNVEEQAKYRLLLGKSHYNLAQMEQAEAELKAFNELKPSNSLIYEGEVFESNILVSKKEHEKAAELLKKLLKEHPERAQSDGLEMNLVACYEDMKDFDAAIKAMEEMREAYPDKEFLDMRISRLRERKNNLPGARGLRR